MDLHSFDRHNRNKGVSVIHDVKPERTYNPYITALVLQLFRFPARELIALLRKIKGSRGERVNYSVSHMRAATSRLKKKQDRTHKNPFLNPFCMMGNSTKDSTTATALCRRIHLAIATEKKYRGPTLRGEIETNHPTIDNGTIAHMQLIPLTSKTFIPEIKTLVCESCHRGGSRPGHVYLTNHSYKRHTGR